MRGYMNAAGMIPHMQFLSDLEMLLTFDAATWAEGNSTVQEIFRKADPTSVDVSEFLELFERRFPTILLEGE